MAASKRFIAMLLREPSKGRPPSNCHQAAIPWPFDGTLNYIKDEPVKAVLIAAARRCRADGFRGIVAPVELSHCIADALKFVGTDAGGLASDAGTCGATRMMRSSAASSPKNA